MSRRHIGTIKKAGRKSKPEQLGDFARKMREYEDRKRKETGKPKRSFNEW